MPALNRNYPLIMYSTIGTSARNSLWLMFFVMGVVSMAWVPRIPEIKEANGLSDSQFGLVLVSSSIGAVLGAQLAGRLIHRFGSRPAMYFAALVVPLGVAIMALSASPFVLVIGLLSDAITLPWAMMYPALALVIAGYLAKTLKS